MRSAAEDNEQRRAGWDEMGAMTTTESTNQRPRRRHSVVHSQVILRAVDAAHVLRVSFDNNKKKKTSGRRILTKGRIAALSPLAAANEFVRHRPHLINGSFLGPTWVSPQTASRSVQPFSQGSRTWSTFKHRQTDATPRYAMRINKPLSLANQMGGVLYNMFQFQKPASYKTIPVPTIFCSFIINVIIVFHYNTTKICEIPTSH